MSWKRRKSRPLRAGAYLIPSLFTTANILLGFYAILAGLEGQFRAAVLMLFAAACLDTLDGRIARVTGAESPFGREYDSLADLVSFGLAPALLAYSWGLQELGSVGPVAPAVYLLCMAARLARFNVNPHNSDPAWFVGLPAPAAAGAIGSILFFVDNRGDSFVLQIVMLSALVAIGLLSVSTFRYVSFKELDPRRRWSFRVVLLIGAVAVLGLMQVAHGLVRGLRTDAVAVGILFLVASASYVLSAPSAFLFRRIGRRWKSARLRAATLRGR